MFNMIIISIIVVLVFFRLVFLVLVVSILLPNVFSIGRGKQQVVQNFGQLVR
jgi:hypothetical protein